MSAIAWNTGHVDDATKALIIQKAEGLTDATRSGMQQWERASQGELVGYRTDLPDGSRIRLIRGAGTWVEYRPPLQPPERPVSPSSNIPERISLNDDYAEVKTFRRSIRRLVHLASHQVRARERVNDAERRVADARRAAIEAPKQAEKKAEFERHVADSLRAKPTRPESPTALG